MSDGDAMPGRVVKWYQRHGYDFLVLTDHNKSSWPIMYRNKDDFLLIHGNEFSVESCGKPVHVCALGYEKKGHPKASDTISDTLQGLVDEARSDLSVPVICHPNWCWAFTHREMMGLFDANLFEIYNPSHDCNNIGGGTSFSTEEMWDLMLSEGKRIFGVASDDAHHYRKRFDKGTDFPGRAWVMVHADKLEKDSILIALDRGDFYSSTGVSLEDLIINNEGMMIKIKRHRDCKYLVEYIGDGGRVLETQYSELSEHYFMAGQKYTRANITASDGTKAWVQPVFLR
ncbi:hypothetical protein COT47_06445 [Candidatus Woesearchaeota archaeon CG08_land_8_20_14_0_20_43_7]|nr:MAG: hypothetical protein COT47_06445 [Candidatus Woesearchaeota archaeon CG08_land_8_20_14_0_20_43_7]